MSPEEGNVEGVMEYAPLVVVVLPTEVPLTKTSTVTPLAIVVIPSSEYPVPERFWTDSVAKVNRSPVSKVALLTVYTLSELA